MLLRTTKLASLLLLLLVAALALSQIGPVESKTAVLFGATGAVGNDILRSLIATDDHYFTKLILVGRREFPPKVNDLLPRSPSELPEIVKIVVPDLGSVDRHEELAAMSADACINAVGAAYPQLSDLHDWNYVETTVAESIARLCGKMNATAISIFTAVNGDSPEPFTEEELAKTGTPMGWWPVMSLTIRMMRLKEKAVASSSSETKIPFVRIFQPSNIITREIRYGWLDWTLFKFHAVFDSWLPTQYHSVTTQLLADAMVKDAANVLSGKNTASLINVGEDGAVRLDYGDFVSIVGKEEAEKRTDL